MNIFDKALEKFYHQTFKNEFIPPRTHFLPNQKIKNTITPNEIDIAIRKPSIRRKSGITFTTLEISSLIRNAAGKNPPNKNNGKYQIPVAGGISDLKLIICKKNSQTSTTDLFEYDINLNKLFELDLTCEDEFWYEDWEKEAQFNLVFCAPSQPQRSYSNNLLHLCFESGMITQNILKIIEPIGANSCISGTINVPQFKKTIGNDKLPLHALSIL